VFFAKGGSRERLRWWVDHDARYGNKRNSTGGIAAHPCKKRKDGAPPVELAHADIIKVGPVLTDYYEVAKMGQFE
jgi:hypothetical protein